MAPFKTFQEAAEAIDEMLVAQPFEGESRLAVSIPSEANSAAIEDVEEEEEEDDAENAGNGGRKHEEDEDEEEAAGDDEEVRVFLPETRRGLR